MGRVRLQSPSAPDYLDYREECDAFEAWGAYVNRVVNISGGENPERIGSVSCTADLLTALRAEPAAGRLFSPEETEHPDSRTVIVSDRLWKRRFGSDPDLVGREILINKESWTVIGIMPEYFRFPDWRSLNEVDLFLPFSVRGSGTDRGSYYLRVIGRLREGTSIEQADADLNSTAVRLQEMYPESNSQRFARVVPLREIVIGNSGSGLWLLMGAVGFVLLIACTNVAGLLMSRSAGRGIEVAIRASIGAGRRRLLRQMLTESMVLGLMGGVAGVLLALLGIGVLRGAIPGSLPRIGELRIDETVLIFTFGLSLLTGILFGLFPALSSSRLNLTGTLREGVRSRAGGRHRARFLGVLIALQFALALVLANGAALMLKSLWTVTGSPELHDPEQVLIAGYSVEEQLGEEEIIQRDPFLEELLERLRALPDVQYAGACTRLPLSGNWTADILTEGQTYDPEVDRGITHMICASTGYIEAMGIPLQQGRTLIPEDMNEGRLGVVVNRTLAEESWPGENPVGKGIRSDSPTPWFEAVVVGVVENVRQSGLESGTGREVYLPFFPGFMQNRWIALRTPGDPTSLVESVRAELAVLDPYLPLGRLFTGADLYGFAAAGRRFSTRLIGLFALIALCLITAGTYGVMSYHVAQRTHEIGIRVALGAGRNTILKLVIERGLWLSLVGVGLGVVGALLTARIIGSMLFEVSPLNPVSIVLTAMFVLLVGLLASFIPAIRATHVDPIEALQTE